MGSDCLNHVGRFVFGSSVDAVERRSLTNGHASAQLENGRALFQRLQRIQNKHLYDCSNSLFVAISSTHRLRRFDQDLTNGYADGREWKQQLGDAADFTGRLETIVVVFKYFLFNMHYVQSLLWGKILVNSRGNIWGNDYTLR